MAKDETSSEDAPWSLKADFDLFHSPLCPFGCSGGASFFIACCSCFVFGATAAAAIADRVACRARDVVNEVRRGREAAVSALRQVSALCWSVRSDRIGLHCAAATQGATQGLEREGRAHLDDSDASHDSIALMRRLSAWTHRDASRVESLCCGADRVAASADHAAMDHGLRERPIHRAAVRTDLAAA